MEIKEAEAQGRNWLKKVAFDLRLHEGIPCVATPLIHSKHADVNKADFSCVRFP